MYACYCIRCQFSSRPGRPPKRTPSGTVLRQQADDWTAQPQIVGSSSLHDGKSSPNIPWLHSPTEDGTVSGSAPTNSASIIPNTSAILSPSLLDITQERITAALSNSADVFALAMTQAQQLAGNTQFLPQQLLLHHMAIAAASMAAVQQEQRTKQEHVQQQQV